MRRRALVVAAPAIAAAVALSTAWVSAAAGERDHQLTITVLGRDGKPAKDHRLFLASYDRATERTPSGPNGRVRVRVPRGRYYLHGSIRAGGRTDRVTAPWLTLNGDTAITLDARTTTPVNVTVPHKDARLFDGVLNGDMIVRKGLRPVVIPGLPIADFAKLGTAQVGPNAPRGRFVGSMQVTLVAPGAAVDSPYSYTLAWFTPGRPYTGSHTVRRAELAKVRARYRPQGRDTSAGKLSLATYAPMPNARVPFATQLPVRLPGTRTEYFNVRDLTWSFGVEPAFDASKPLPDWDQQVPSRTYRAGRRYYEVWNGAGVFGPSLPPAEPEGYAGASAKALSMRVPIYGATADTSGSIKGKAHTVVYRDGAKVGRSDDAASCHLEGKPKPGRYRITTELKQSLNPTSTTIRAEWTFRYSGPTAPGKPTALPVQVIRFSPVLDETNAAPGGFPYLAGITVHRNPGAAPAAVTIPQAEVSYDDGATWRKTPVIRRGKHWAALLRHPRSGWVSLRAQATDTTGNATRLTIIRAYRLT
ncbi:hypothetical protein SMC26_14080 [Actinomadura fulvescens]|uniref:Serine protease n=1 Tax=Actinomadura fulvescens TaxID=46160 RepID=A0ABP6CC46_9ACTN